MTTATVIAALERACTLLDASEESAWSVRRPSEVAADFRGAAALLHRGEAPDLLMLRLEFAPTSTVEEIAIANDWHDDYLKLAAIVDEYVRHVDREGS